MNYSKVFFFGILAMLLAFSSCKKEEISQIEEVIPEVNTETTVTNPLVYKIETGSTSDGLDLGCFSIDFPFDLVADGTTYTINDVEDFDEVFLSELEYVDFAYPVNITYNADGTTASIADGEALGEAFASCVPDDGWGEDLFPAFLIDDESSCYQMVYPVNLVDSDGNVVAVNDEAEFIDLISSYENILFFQFPINLIDEEGNNVTANDVDELFVLLFACDDGVENPDGGNPDNDDCWDFTYPFSIVDQDGNVYDINNHEDLCSAALYGLELEYVFPLTLANGSGEELVVNNQEELEAAWADCWGGVGEFDLDLFSFIFNSDIFGYSEECYSINYPLEYVNTYTEATGTLDDAVAAEAYLNGEPEFFDVVVFPVTVTEVETGNQITLDDTEAYFNFIFSCQ